MADGLSQAASWEARGRLNLAMAEYDRLIDNGGPGIEALMRRATLFRERGDLSRAVADLEQAAALAPSDPWPKLRLGQTANSAGRSIAAASYMQAALDVAPEQNEFRVNAAHTYSVLGYLDLAYRAVRMLPERLPDWWAKARRTAVTEYRERRAMTIGLLRELRRADDVSREDRWRLCQALFALGRLAMARRLCEALVEEGPHSPPAFYFLAQIIARQDGLEQAIAFLERSDTIKADLPDFPIRLGRLLHEAGRYEEALQHFYHPAVAELDSEELRWSRFISLLLLGKREKLLDYCREWLRQAPDSLAPAGYLAAMCSVSTEASARPMATVIALRPHIVQFWDAPSIPPDVQRVMQSWVDAHPYARHIVFDEEQARRFLSDHYGSEIVKTYDLCHHPAMKADYFRVAFLYQAGGVYADADEICLQPMDDVISFADDAEIIATLSGDVPGYLHNWFLGGRPRSLVLRSALEDATTGVQRDAQAGRRPDIWLATGPGLITRAVGRYLTSQGRREDEALMLMPLQQYRTLARTESGLAYKTSADANWQLS